MRVITGIIGSDPLVLVCFWPNRDPRESPCKVFYVPNDYRLLATGKTSAGTFVKTAMYMVILILLYDTVCYLQIHNAIGVVGSRLILVVKSLDETALDVKDFQAPCPHWPGQEDGGLALTFNVQFLPGKLSLHSRNFKKSQFLVTEKEQKRKPVIGVWHERWKTSNVPIPAAAIKHSENGRKLTNDCGMLNNSAAVPGVLQIKFLRTTLINLQFFYCKTGSLIPSQIFLSSYKSAVISRPTC